MKGENFISLKKQKAKQKKIEMKQSKILNKNSFFCAKQNKKIRDFSRFLKTKKNVLSSSTKISSFHANLFFFK